MTRWLVVIALLGGCKKEAEPEKVELPAPPTSAFPDAAPRRPLARALSPTESAFAGTWVARVDDRASQTRMHKEGTFMAPPGVTLGGCIWLELYDDLTGYRDECAIVNGEPSALDGKNALTGRSQRLAFDWEAPDAASLTITYRDDVFLPGAGPFRTWKLAAVRQDGDHIVFQERFPDLGSDAARESAWEIIPGRYLGDGK
jgi:hypothetical protein